MSAPNGKEDPSVSSDALKPEFAGVAKRDFAVAFHVLVKPNARSGLGQDHCRRRALADKLKEH